MLENSESNYRFSLNASLKSVYYYFFFFNRQTSESSEHKSDILISTNVCCFLALQEVGMMSYLLL